VNVTGYWPGATAGPTLILKTTLLPVVAIGSEGLDLMPLAGAGGVMVTLPANPPVRVMLTTTLALVPAWAVTVAESNPSEKSGPAMVRAMFTRR